MRTFLKFVLVILSTLLLIVIAGIVLIVAMINPNNFKTQISKQVFAQTGRHLIIGNMTWTIFPWLGIKGTDITLGNNDGFAALPFMQAKTMDINARLMPLIHGRIEIGHLTLDGVTLNLITDTQGVSDWQDLTYNVASSNQSLPASGNIQINNYNNERNENVTVISQTNSGNNTAVNEQSIAANHNTKKSNLTFSISSIALTNANINWVDAPKNQVIAVHITQFKSDNIGFDHPFPLALDVTSYSNQPALSGNVSLDTQILVNRQQQSLTLQNLHLKAQSNGKQFPDGHLNLALNADTAIVTGKQLELSIPQFSADIANMHLQGSLQNEAPKNLYFNGALQVADFNLKQFLVAIGKTAPQTQDASVLQHVSASCQFEVKDNELSIQQLQAQLDDTKLNGDITVSHFSDPKINMNLTADSINLDRYSSADNATDSTVSASNGSINNSANANSTQSELLPVDTLRKINASGHLSIGSLHIAKLDITQFDTQFNAEKGLISLNPLQGQMYQGQMTNNIAIDVRQATPRLAIISHFSNINIDPLLSSLVKITRIQVSGIGDLSATIAASGNDVSSIKHTLSGNTKFSISNGVLKGIDILYYYDFADSLIHKQVPSLTNTKQTPFGDLTGTATINNGLVSNNDLVIQSPGLTVTGKGTADLVSEKLNYAMIMQRMTDGVNSQTKGPAIPLNITGTFDNPSIQPDVLSIVQAAFKQQVEKEVQKILPGGVSQQIQNSIGNGNIGQQLQQGLKSFLGH